MVKSITVILQTYTVALQEALPAIEKIERIQRHVEYLPVYISAASPYNNIKQVTSVQKQVTNALHACRSWHLAAAPFYKISQALFTKPSEIVEISIRKTNG